MEKHNKYLVKCPRCKTEEIWKVGYIPTIKGRVDRFKCTHCGHSFYRGQPNTIVVVRVKRSPVKKLVEKLGEAVEPVKTKSTKGVGA